MKEWISILAKWKFIRCSGVFPYKALVVWPESMRQSILGKNLTENGPNGMKVLLRNQGQDLAKRKSTNVDKRMGFASPLHYPKDDSFQPFHKK